jgi:hypothetical protein
MPRHGANFHEVKKKIKGHEIESSWFSNGDKEDTEFCATELTSMTLSRSPRDTRCSSRGPAVGIKRIQNSPPRS